MNNSVRVNEILVNNGLDFTIVKKPLVSIDGDKSPYFGLYNDKTGQCINSVKAGYTVSQNAEIIDLILQGMSKFGADLTVQKAGTIGDGKKVYCQLAIEGTSKVGDDIIKKYVTVIDSNDGSTSLSVGIGDLTMSCQNQFLKFYKEGQSKFRHTASMQKRINEIPFLIEIAFEETFKQIQMYNKFASTECSIELANELVKSILGYDRQITSVEKLSGVGTRGINIMNKMYEHIKKETNQKGLNLWGLHSGITSFTTHEQSKGEFNKIIEGVAYKYNQKSLEFVANKIGIFELV